MGKAIPRNIKIRSESLIKLFPEKFSRDFDKNKIEINELDLPFSKTDRNLMAGFITRKMAEAQA